jgi:lipoate-protein ligase A
MAVDLALLHAAAREESGPTLRFYSWSPPAVSLGRFQAVDGIDLEYARRRGWDVVRRSTGGRAVLHHLELTYSLALPPSVVSGVGVRSSYTALVAGIHAGLRSLLSAASPVGALPPLPCDARENRNANCFALAGECDTLLPGGKLVGSAQARKDGALLQHGSILLDADPEAWTALFGSPGRLLTLRQLLGEAPLPGRVANAVVDGFCSLGVRLEPGALGPEEIDLAAELLAEGALAPGLGRSMDPTSAGL